MIREAILEATRIEIEAQGPNEFSTNAIAARAGVGKGTIFRHFGDRAGLVSALVDDFLRDFETALTSGPPPLGPGAPPAERLEAFVVEGLSWTRDNLALGVTSQMVFAQNSLAAFGPMHAHITGLLRELGLEEGAEILATMLAEAVSPVTLQVLLELRGDSFEDVVATARILVAGIVAQGRASS